MLAEYYAGTTYFVTKDHLGSARVVSGVNQSLIDTLDYYPFGSSISGGASGTHKFTGDEWDSESSSYHTEFRQYSPSLARWTMADPGGLGVVVPANPQSWNRYTYVLNNPLRGTDPTGLTCFLWVQTAGNSEGDNQEWGWVQVGLSQDDCSGFGAYGMWISMSTTVFVSSIDGGSLVSTGYVEVDGQPTYSLGDIFSWSKKNKVPCSKSLGHRVIQGALGATNLTLAGIKSAALGTTDAIAVIGAPETAAQPLRWRRLLLLMP